MEVINMCVYVWITLTYLGITSESQQVAIRLSRSGYSSNKSYKLNTTGFHSKHNWLNLTPPPPPPPPPPPTPTPPKKKKRKKNQMCLSLIAISLNFESDLDHHFNTNMYFLSVERSFYSTCICCIQISYVILLLVLQRCVLTECSFGKSVFWSFYEYVHFRMFVLNSLSSFCFCFYRTIHPQLEEDLDKFRQHLLSSNTEMPELKVWQLQGQSLVCLGLFE